MTRFIGFEVLVANALIHEMESSDKREISVARAQEYAQKVSKNLDQADVRHVIVYGGNRFQDCERYFAPNDANGVFVVNDGVSYEDLRDTYRGILSYEVLKACVKAEEEFDINEQKTL